MGVLRTAFSNFSEIMAIAGFAEEGEFDTARKMLEEIEQINPKKMSEVYKRPL